MAYNKSTHIILTCSRIIAYTCVVSNIKLSFCYGYIVQILKKKNFHVTRMSCLYEYMQYICKATCHSAG